MVIVKTLKFSGILAAIITAGISATAASAAINVNVDTDKGVKKISPYLYGRNIFCNEDRGDLNDVVTTLSEKEQTNLETYRQAGIRYLRMNNGNNATKHNWRKNLSSHPDYYNNVYKHDWDISSKKILDNLPGVDGMYAFQLAGYVASSTAYNFKDWDWKQSHGGKNAKQTLDLAGGGTVDDDGVTLIHAGDYRLYLEEWPADSTVKIIPHWKDELKYDMKRFQYWSMDNEMELWRGTHSDLPYTYPNEDGNTVAADRMVDNYIAVAKAAKAINPDLKLTGPVAANEWSWCNIAYDNNSTSYVKATDHKYCWLEYFIKRLGEEQKRTSVQLLDVFDIHWYPTEKTYESWINWHRVFFDTTYVYPGGNGIRCADISTTGSCDWNTGKGVGYKTYIFKRITDWMKKYMGENYKYTLGFTETDFIGDMDAMSRALAYASFMGTFIDHGVEIFTPWTWREGMYEVVHLFSRYGHENRVQSTSSNDSLVSAYSSISNKGDSLTVIFVNRAENNPQDVYLSLDGFKAENTANALTLSGIAGETFVSHTSNGLKKNAVNVKMTGGMTNATENYANKFSMTLPAKSITAVLLTTNNPKVVDAIATTAVRPNYSVTLQGREILVSGIQQNSRYALTNTLGQVIRSGLWNGAAGATLKLSVPATGRYILQVGGKSQMVVVNK